MPSELIGEYEIECTGVKILDGETWAAHLAIYASSPNPMHRKEVFPAQRVCVETEFSSQEAAEAEARVVAISMIG